MSQARLLAGASSRVLECSNTATARGLNNRNRISYPAARYSSNYVVGSLNLRLRGGLSIKGYLDVERAALLASFPYARRLSTNTPQTSASVKTAKPPPPPVPNKKAKIELRPGPTKLSPNGTKPSVAPAAQPQVAHSHEPSRAPHPTKPPSLTSSSPKKQALKDSQGQGVIDITKNDLNDAARHGLLKPAPEGASRIGRLIHLAKELFKFYWAGLKLIFADRKDAKRIQERVSSGGAALTWGEHRFILTNNSDMIKLIPFLMTVIIAEELIPLMVLYVPGMLPSTCILPSQRERIEAKRHERQSQAYASAKASDAFKNAQIENVQLNSLANEEVGLLCDIVGISSLGLFGIQKGRLRRYLHKIAIEDNFLLKEGKGDKLRQMDVATVLCDRGFLAESCTPSQQRDRLRWWLDNVESASEKSPEDIRAQLLVLMLREARP